MKFHRSASCSVVGSNQSPDDLSRNLQSLDLRDAQPFSRLKSNLSNKFSRSSSEHSRRLIAFGYNLTSSLTDAIIVYPCLVLRRRCQVSCMGQRYHLTPISIFDVAFRLQGSQGITCLWKGVGSHLILNAMTFGVESSMSELDENLAMDVNRHSKIKKLFGHVMLKALSAAVVIPFFSAHVVESVESEAASEPRGLFGFVFEGFYRLAGYAGIQSQRLLPFRHLLFPTVLYFVAKYLLSNILEFFILSVFKYNEKRKHDNLLNSAHPFSPVDKDFKAIPGSSRMNENPLTSLHVTRTTHFESQYHEFLSNFIANLASDVLLYPFETALFRLHVQGTRTIIDDMDRGKGFLPVSSHHEGFIDCFQSINYMEGRLGYFRGFGALILQYVLRYSIFKFIHILSQLYA